MIKTIALKANTETEVELTGGCHVSIENRGTGIIYASKAAGVTAGADGVIAIDSGNAKVLRNVAQYKNDDDNKSYDYYGKIYLLSDSDTKAEIQTANDLNFFSRKNSTGGGESGNVEAEIQQLQANKISVSDVITNDDIDEILNS